MSGVFTGAACHIAAVARVAAVHVVGNCFALGIATLGIAAVRSLGFGLGFVGFRYPKKYTALKGLGGLLAWCRALSLRYRCRLAGCLAI